MVGFSMFDYGALSALAAVIEMQGFQEAAQKLFITQSAVSQRVKSLEKKYGEPVLIRTTPYRPTQLGLKLLSHFKRVALLEQNLHDELTSAVDRQRVSIAISRDSLETWFKEVMDRLKLLPAITLEIIADDQEQTLRYLQNGLVAACASTTEKKLSNCRTEFLGYFDYVLVASPDFKRRHFSNKNSKKNLLHAPALLFDTHDRLHGKYLKHFFNIDDHDINYSIIPSVAGFRQFALNGYAYALIPYIDIITELKQKKLVNLFPDKIWHMPIYWHMWDIEPKFYKLFNELVFKIARQTLRQK